MPKLYFMCGKMAAGKSTHARKLAEANHAVLFILDELLDALYPDEIRVIDDFARRSTSVREALTPYVLDLLARGISVVLDFPGNTQSQRNWFRILIETAGVEHELHYIDATDDVCKNQLKLRSRALPAGAPWTTEEEFEAITALFQAPAETERFNVVHHVRS